MNAFGEALATILEERAGLEAGELERAVQLGPDDGRPPYIVPAIRGALELTEPENRRLSLAHYEGSAG